MWNARLDEIQAGIKIVSRNINNHRYAEDTPFMAESEEELKSLLIKVKEWKSWLKTQHSENDHGIQFHHFMANRWGKNGNTDRFYFLWLQNYCRLWLHHLFLGRKAMTNLDSIKKQRHYFADKCQSSQSYGFSNSHVWMWELDCKESWAPKNWYFWTVVLEKTWESLGLQGDPTSPS